MSQKLDLNVIKYQNNLRSKPVRENFTDLQNNYNLLRTEVYASIASTASEVIVGRDNFGTLVDNINERKVVGNKIDGSSDYKVTATNLVLSINSGSGIVNGVGVYHSTSGTASVTVPAASNSRYDLLVVNTDNTRSILLGTATTGTAEIPTSALTQMPVGRWLVYDTTATLSVVDLRYKALDVFQDDNYSDIAFNYTGETMTSYDLIDTRNVTNSYDMSYSGETLATLGVTVGTNRVVATFTYNGDTLSTVSQSIS